MSKSLGPELEYGNFDVVGADAPHPLADVRQTPPPSEVASKQRSFDGSN